MALFAYQLAAAVDDAQPHFNSHRARERTCSTPLIASAGCKLRFGAQVATVRPRHALVCAALTVNKLSKQNGAPEVNLGQAADNLRQCLDAASPSATAGLGAQRSRRYSGTRYRPLEPRQCPLHLMHP